MPLLLGIETSTTVCSAALNKGNDIIIEKHVDNGYTHAENLPVFIRQLFEETNYTMNDLEGVVISEGPGSYTGLRIGCSLAKGICYAKNIPLIAVNTLEALAFNAIENHPGFDKYFPMLDARRMEIYTAAFDYEFNNILPTQPVILDEINVSDFFKAKKLAIFGDGATKTYEILKDKIKVTVLNVLPNAGVMNKIGAKKLASKSICDLAYFEPFYLKPFLGKKTTT
jgi:tRNA threonylcarbamoyladenosine biosynthesis protein TsaB